MPKEISVPIAWIKRLDSLTDSYLATLKNTVANEDSLNLLIGFLQSIKFLIK